MRLVHEGDELGCVPGRRAGGFAGGGGGPGVDPGEGVGGGGEVAEAGERLWRRDVRDEEKRGGRDNYVEETKGEARGHVGEVDGEGEGRVLGDRLGEERLDVWREQDAVLHNSQLISSWEIADGRKKARKRTWKNSNPASSASRIGTNGVPSCIVTGSNGSVTSSFRMRFHPITPRMVITTVMAHTSCATARRDCDAWSERSETMRIASNVPSGFGGSVPEKSFCQA